MDPLLKGQTVDIALTHLSLSGALINPSGKDQKDFLKFQELMLASWENEGLYMGFRFSSFGIDSDAADISGINYNNASAVGLCLAVYGASSKGLMCPPDLKKEAFVAKMNLHPAQIIERQTVSLLPTGSGNDPFGVNGSRYPVPEDPYLLANGGDLDDLEL